MFAGRARRLPPPRAARRRRIPGGRAARALRRGSRDHRIKIVPYRRFDRGGIAMLGVMIVGGVLLAAGADTGGDPAGGDWKSYEAARAAAGRDPDAHVR